MAKFVVNYQKAIELKTVATTLHNWLLIQTNAGMFPEDLDRIIIGWIAGEHDLIFNSSELQ